jgi:histidinol phosphatase-like PHP family hydrolase
MKLIDLHTHTFFSDGVLSPSELVYRYKERGCEIIAITDHADYSNIEHVLHSISKAKGILSEFYKIKVVSGIELTYIPPPDISRMVIEARKAGAELVIVHGESSVEVVPQGTNLAAVEAKCDILAHPGNLTEEVAVLAAENRVAIEITTRKGHRNTNEQVYIAASKAGCLTLINSDSHQPEDLLDTEKIKDVLGQIGLKLEDYENFTNNSLELIRQIQER